MSDTTPTNAAALPAVVSSELVRHRRSVLCGLLITRGLGDAPYCNWILAEELYGIPPAECVDAANAFLARSPAYPDKEWQDAERKWEREHIMPNKALAGTDSTR